MQNYLVANNPPAGSNLKDKCQSESRKLSPLSKNIVNGKRNLPCSYVKDPSQEQADCIFKIDENA
jgi:hypothetical protein